MRQVDFTLYLITDRKLTGARGLAATVEAALRGAADFAPHPPVAVQLREKDLAGRALLELAMEIGAICRRYHVPMLVNERIDVALAAGADGVHLPSNGIEADDARRLLGPDSLIGVSTHQASEIIRAASQGADFAVFGPVFAPISKGSYTTPCGREGLAAACAAAPIPVLALGGITAARIPELAGAGTRGVALIGAVMAAADPAASVRQLLGSLRQWR